MCRATPYIHLNFNFWPLPNHFLVQWVGKFALQLLVVKETWKHLSDRCSLTQTKHSNIATKSTTWHTYVHPCHLFPLWWILHGRQKNKIYFEQGEAFLRGTLPWPRRKGGEKKKKTKIKLTEKIEILIWNWSGWGVGRWKKEDKNQMTKKKLIWNWSGWGVGHSCWGLGGCCQQVR